MNWEGAKVSTTSKLTRADRYKHTVTEVLCAALFSCCVRKTNVSVGRFRRLTVMITGFQRFRLSLSPST
jgi:hypothetical protein